MIRSIVRPIRTEADYEAALEEIAGLMDAERDTLRGDRLDVLVTLVEAYEARHWSIAPPDPIDAIRLRMAQLGLDRRALEPLIGSRARVSEVLNRRRPLTLPMMRRLHEALQIPAGSFFREAAPIASRTTRSTTKKAARRTKGA